MNEYEPQKYHRMVLSTAVGAFCSIWEALFLFETYLYFMLNPLGLDWSAQMTDGSEPTGA